MSKNILITGTGGYVGSHLANSLEKSGNKVSRLSVRNSLWENQSFTDYDVIIHTAALVHNNDPSAQLEDYFRINMHLPNKLANKAKKDGVNQFIFMSTMAVFGEDGVIGKNIEITDPMKIKPITDYGKSKAKAEEKLLNISSSSFKVVIIRPPMIYGEDSPGNFTKLKKVAKLLPIIPNIHNYRSALYIKHLEQYVNEIITHKKAGIYHPKDEFEFNTTNVIKEIRKNENKSTILLPVPKTIYPLLNKVKFITNLYGNLVYGKDLYLSEEKININQQEFENIIKDIMNKD